MTFASGWVGDCYYQKFGNVVTLDFAFNKTTWAVNDQITTTALPVGIRPMTNLPASGVNSAQNNAPRSVWISSSDGFFRAAEAGTGSIWGSISYQVASVERSTAMNSGAMTTAITAGAGVTIGAGTQAHVRGGVVQVDLNLNLPASLAANSIVCTLPDGFRPVDYWWETVMVVTGVETVYRVTVSPDGTVRNQIAWPAGLPVVRDSITFPAALSAAGLGTLLDTGWLSGGNINVPNVPVTTNFYKYRRVGNTVTIRATVTLTGGINNAYIDLKYPMAADTLLSDAHVIGRVRAIRSGVAWYQFDVVAERLSPGRGGIYLQDGSGAQVTATSPAGATWAAGDRWGFDIEYEAAPL
jgi:hypothetical protein